MFGGCSGCDTLGSDSLVSVFGGCVFEALSMLSMVWRFLETLYR